MVMRLTCSQSRPRGQLEDPLTLALASHTTQLHQAAAVTRPIMAHNNNNVDRQRLVVRILQRVSHEVNQTSAMVVVVRERRRIARVDADAERDRQAALPPDHKIHATRDGRTCATLLRSYAEQPFHFYDRMLKRESEWHQVITARLAHLTHLANAHHIAYPYAGQQFTIAEAFARVGAQLQLNQLLRQPHLAYWHQLGLISQAAAAALEQPLTPAMTLQLSILDNWFAALPLPQRLQLQL